LLLIEFKEEIATEQKLLLPSWLAYRLRIYTTIPRKTSCI
jgi:hypothetical protein